METEDVIYVGIELQGGMVYTTVINEWTTPDGSNMKFFKVAWGGGTSFKQEYCEILTKEEVIKLKLKGLI